MLSIDINHPDVMDFIKIKRDGTSVTGANISTKITNEFMKAVENNEDYFLRFPCNIDFNRKYVDGLTRENGVGFDDKEFPKIYDKLIEVEDLEWYQNTGKHKTYCFVKRIKAREYWEEIIKSAHGYAEPGIIFVDNHHDYSPDGVYPQFKGVTTNPCGEIFMQPYDACRLIALNLYSFVKNPFTKDAEFDSDKFYRITYEAMRLSDDLIDLELKHIDRIIEKISKDATETSRTELELWLNIRSTAEASRRTGLGFTALGDCLAALGYKYDSEEALLFIEQMMHIKMEAELDCTIDLAILRGSFKGWDKNIEFTQQPDIVGRNDFYDFILDQYPTQAKRMMQYGRRNVSWNTVAPTGTVNKFAA